MNYDAWRTSPPEEPELHPGPHAVGLAIESEGICIDALGHYDGEGILQSVQIGQAHFSPEIVQQALSLLGLRYYTNWSDNLDDATLRTLSDGAYAADADGYADWRRDSQWDAAQ